MQTPGRYIPANPTLDLNSGCMVGGSGDCSGAAHSICQDIGVNTADCESGTPYQNSVLTFEVAWATVTYCYDLAETYDESDARWPASLAGESGIMTRYLSSARIEYNELYQYLRDPTMPGMFL